MAIYLVDTNVMLAASAVNELSSLAVRAMPQEVELREQVFNWLAEFEESDNKILLDEEGLIRAEYERNMPFNMREQEYGMKVLQHKIDHYLAEHVPIETLDANGEHIAVLAPEHAAIVTDREDRKWVACALAALEYLDETAPVVYGAETDWYVAEQALRAIGMDFRRLLPEGWYEQRVAP